MIIQIFVLKVINNERKTLTHHKIIDRVAQQRDKHDDHSSVQTIKTVNLSELTAAKLLINCFL